jgi:hypothetical protein
MRVEVAAAVRGTYCREKKEEKSRERREELVVMVRRGIGQS